MQVQRLSLSVIWSDFFHRQIKCTIELVFSQVLVISAKEQFTGTFALLRDIC